MLKLRILAVIIMGLVLAIGTVAPQHGAAQLSTAAAPTLRANFKLSGSDTSSNDAGKYPRTEAFDNTVHIVSNPAGKVTYWSKDDSATTTSSGTGLGSVSGKTTYANAATAVRSNGTVYVAWIKQGSGIFIRSKAIGADWTGVHAVYSTSSFLAFVDVAVSTTGTIVVAWNESGSFLYRYSSNAGGSWSGTHAVTSKTPYGAIRLTNGPNGSIVTAFGSNTGHVYAGIWNGSGFDNTDLTPSKASGDFFADPSAAIAPNGKIYVAWRNAPGGLYYSERQSNGTWPVSRLISGQVYSQVAVSADANNNLHIAWAGEPSGGWDVWYAFKPVSGDWQGPIHVSDNGLYVANPDLGSSVGANAYGHVVYEAFSGVTSDRYALFSSATTPALGAQPVIDSGAPYTKNDSVSVSFPSAGVQGSPKELRWRWGAAPTDALHDSTGTNGWQTYTNPVSIALPAHSTPNACAPLTLYTQVKDGSTIEATAKSDAINSDQVVEANVEVLNPHLAGLPKTFASVADKNDQSASDGDQGYTRDKQAFLRIVDVPVDDRSGDCSGLSDFTVVEASPVKPNPVFSNGLYQGKISLAQVNNVSPGATIPVNVVVTDVAGNLDPPFPRSIIYDPANTNTDPQGTPNTDGLPKLKSNTNPTVDNANSIIRTLTFSSIDVDDTVYGANTKLPAGRQFWGLWIANATTDVGASDPNLEWVPVHVPDPTASPLKVQWDIFSGLSLFQGQTITRDLLDSKAGTYYVYVRFLDGAGNPSLASTALKVPVTIQAGYSIPTIHIAVIDR